MLETPTPVAEEMDPAIRALLPNYIRRRESDVESIALLMGRKDFTEIGRLAHNMRGSGAAYGYPKITELGGQIEEAARIQDVDAITALAEELNTCVKNMRS